MNLRNTQVMSISLPPQVAEEINKISKAEKMNKSELVREMVRVYKKWKWEKDWQKIRAIGEDIQKKYNLKNEDDLFKLIHGD